MLSQRPGPSGPDAKTRVLIVGGGPAGIVSLRNFLQDEGDHSGQPGLEAVLYERRENVGGVWFLDDETLQLEKQTGYVSGRWPVASSSHLRFPSPCYPALVGNVLPRFISFSGAPLPPPDNGDMFPNLVQTYQYLQQVAAPLRHRIKTKREVKNVWELPYLPPSQDSQDSLPRSGGWLVHTIDHATSPASNLYEHFSALSFCPSFTTHPAYPNIPGLGLAMQAVPEKVHHAKYYRSPEPFWASKRVVVVGYGVSANDIIRHIVEKRQIEYGDKKPADEEPIWRPVRHEAVEMFPALPDERIVDTPPIVRIDLRPVPNSSTPAMDLTLASGDILRDVDHLVWGTGYQVGCYDWLRVLARPTTETDVLKLAAAGLNLDESTQSWQVDEARLSQVGFHETQAGLDDLYVRLTPPAKYPSVDEHDEMATTKRQEAVPTVLSSLVATPSTDEDNEFDRTYPNRVPHLHSHVLNARNPTLAFGALIISVTPFVLADLVSRYIRLVWQGDRSLSTTSFEERREMELQRWMTLKATKERLAKEAREEADRASSSQANGEDLPKEAGQEPPCPIELNGSITHEQIQRLSSHKSLPPSGLLAYHIPGKDEFALQKHLRSAVLEKKPWLKGIWGLTDEEWTDDREVQRLGMYNLKKEVLIKKEEERKERVASSMNGVVTNGSS